MARKKRTVTVCNPEKADKSEHVNEKYERLLKQLISQCIKDEEIKEIYDKFKKEDLIQKLKLSRMDQMADLQTLLHSLKLDPDNEYFKNKFKLWLQQLHKSNQLTAPKVLSVPEQHESRHLTRRRNVVLGQGQPQKGDGQPKHEDIEDEIKQLEKQWIKVYEETQKEQFTSNNKASFHTSRVNKLQEQQNNLFSDLIISFLHKQNKEKSTPLSLSLPSSLLPEQAAHQGQGQEVPEHPVHLQPPHEGTQQRRPNQKAERPAFL